MYELTYEQAAVICLGLAMIASACYALGYQAANSHNQYRVRRAENRARLAERRINDLGNWVRSNWPDELAAFNAGHTQGYQQALDHSALPDEDEAA